jgi:hypothetical protein
MDPAAIDAMILAQVSLIQELAATPVFFAQAAVAFVVVWSALFSLERHTLDPLSRTVPRFPTPQTLT